MENKPKSKIEAAHIRIAAELFELSTSKAAMAAGLGLPRGAGALDTAAALSQVLADITNPPNQGPGIQTLNVQI